MSSISVGMKWMAGLLLLVAVGCTAADVSDEDLGMAQLQITNAPADVRCIVVTVVGATRTVERKFDVMPGASSIFHLDGLPLGSTAFSGKAFPAACATATGMPNFVSEPVVVTLSTTTVPSVRLVMQRNGQADVNVDFEPDPACVPDNTAACAGKSCGNVTNNCGQSVSCGTCAAPNTCGGSGMPNQCGCAPNPSVCANRPCGSTAVDACGNVHECFRCPAGRICEDNVCVPFNL